MYILYILRFKYTEKKGAFERMGIVDKKCDRSLMFSMKCD